MDFIKYNLEEIFIAAIVIAVAYLIFFIVKSKKRRRKIGFYYNFILYKLGINKRMPKTYIGMVHVRENYEPLVEISHPKIIFSKETVEQPVMLRKEVAARLYKIANKLPNEQYIKIYSAYRSRIALYNVWKEEVARAEKENLKMQRSELLELVKFKVSAPNINMGGHDTGAAIDIAICDKNGNDMDYGTKYHETSQAGSLTPLNAEQKNNQKYLMKLMRSQNFIQQPGQWWHYSYGDRYWAVYKGKRTGAFYGAAEKEFENTGYARVIKTIVSSNI